MDDFRTFYELVNDAQQHSDRKVDWLDPENFNVIFFHPTIIFS